MPFTTSDPGRLCGSQGSLKPTNRFLEGNHHILTVLESFPQEFEIENRGVDEALKGEEVIVSLTGRARGGSLSIWNTI